LLVTRLKGISHASDYQLCEALLGEVRRRTLFFAQRKPKIMVFYEADTLSGQALALTLETLAKFPDPANLPHENYQSLEFAFSRPPLPAIKQRLALDRIRFGQRFAALRIDCKSVQRNGFSKDSDKISKISS
jgi:hypothetical protein